ncbi:MAG: glycoside hydrolase [Acidobacteriota bacterium]|nr:glycoside hydrolase [Acidobacteriota bacterium]
MKLCLLLAAASAIAFAQPYPPELFSELKWRNIGPYRGGRTVAATGVPGQPNVYYMAANNGGVWKSTDFGHVWKPLFDGQPTQSIGAIAVAPSDPNIIYVGSGEGLQRPDLSVGDGIYKSTDAGKTWQHLGLRDGQQISAILVDPRDPLRVYVAVLGHPYGPNAERGVFRSTDGGATWEKVLGKDENTGAVELAFDPKNPRIIYADLWSARLGPWENGTFFGPGSGLHKSTDGGATWKPLTRGLPTFEQGLGRIGLGVAPSDGDRIYAMVDASAAFGGLYRSDDAGESWTRVNGEGRIWGRGSDFAGVRVDPTNRGIVYVANTSTYRSTDGGVSFIAIKGAPGGDDYHTIWINPNDPKNILLGADQGATLTVNGGETWSSWYNQSTAQFYHVITDNRFPYWVYGAQQESGSAGVASRSDYGEITFRDWHPVGVEEYGYVAPDPLHPGVIFGGKVTRFEEATGNVQQVGPAVIGNKYRFLRTAPLVFSSVDPHALFLGSQMVMKTVNGGHSWQVISPDLSRPAWDVPPTVGVFAGQNKERGNRRGVVYAIAPSYKDLNVIWAGTDDGLIHITRDGGAHWRNVTPPELTAWSKISLIGAGRFDSLTAYAAVNRIRLDDLHPHVYRTHDGGKTWTQTVAGLPENAPVNAVREDPVRKGLLYAGTELGVFVSFDDGDHWQALMSGLPPTSVRDIVVHENDLVAGTHGRGVYILDDITPLRQLNAAAVNAGAFLFKPEPAYRIRRNQNTDTPLPPEEPAGKNPPDGAILNYFLTAAGPVTLEIFDSTNHLVRRYASTDVFEPPEQDLNVPLYWLRHPVPLSAEPGLHRFVWDLHGAPPAALQHEYPISAIYGDTPRLPLGPAVLPGRYTVKLTAGGKSNTQPLPVKMDPRVKTPAAGLARQFQLATKVSGMMRQDADALREVRATLTRLKGTNAELEAKLAALAGSGAGRRTRGGGSESLTRLNGELAQVLAILDGSDDTPTTQAIAAVAELESALNSQLAEWRELQAR